MSPPHDPEALAAVGPEAVVDLLKELLRRTHLSAPDDVAAVVADQARSIGATDVGLYLIDYDLATLMPLAAGPDDEREPLSVVGTVAGRAYAASTILRTPAEQPGHQRFWPR